MPRGRVGICLSRVRHSCFLSCRLPDRAHPIHPMTRILRSCGVSLVLLLLGARLCCSQETGSEEDKQALRALGARYEAAINGANLTPLSDAVMPGASAVFMTGDEIKGLPAMQQFLEHTKTRLGNGAQYSIKLVPDATDFYGDTAVAHGTSEESVVFGGGRAIQYTTRWTAVLRKIDGRWMAARLHVSLDPINNPIVEFAARSRLLATGAAAAAVGIGLGWLASRLFRARKQS